MSIFVRMHTTKLNVMHSDYNLWQTSAAIRAQFRPISYMGT